MSQSQSYVAGTVVRFVTSVPFTDFAGNPVNPDYVYLKYSVQGQTEVVFEWVNPTGDPTSTITNTSTGNFQADLPTTGLPGTWVWGWSSVAGSGADITGTEVVWVGELLISPDPL
jgi:hypothetical protein